MSTERAKMTKHLQCSGFRVKVVVVAVQSRCKVRFFAICAHSYVTVQLSKHDFILDTFMNIDEVVTIIQRHLIRLSLM